MQYCTACNKAHATVHVLDLQDGSIVEQKHLCASCAENAGLIAQKVPPLTLHHAEMLDLIGNIKLTGGSRRTDEPTCPACELSATEFRSRGRMGCARCYEVFKPSLLPLLERVHDATSHRGRAPGRAPPPPPPGDHRLRDLRQRLDDAVDAEDYEEAAKLRDEIRELGDAGAQQ